MPNINLNSTNYVHSYEPNTNDLTMAMDYNPAGQPILRTAFGGQAYDAFGRMRVSQPFTLFDSFHRYQDNGKISVATAVNGASTHDVNSSSILMTVTNENGSYVKRESSRVFAYQPGKGLQIMMTFTMNAAKDNLRQRIGYFDVDNGIFLQQDGSTISLVRRSKSSGSVVDTVIPQSQWNIDTLDGNGNSKITLDLTKSQILFIDIEWLGVGTVRAGFVIDGYFIEAHHFHHSNIATSTYMGTAILPVRAEIENTGVTASSSTFRIICATVISEGGYELRGRPRAAGHLLSSAYRMSTPGTIYPLLSIRLKSTRLGAVVIPQDYSVAVTAASNFRYLIMDKGITTGGTWVDAGTDSSVEYNLTATSVSNGTIVEEGYIIASNQSASAPSLQQLPFRYQLERNTFSNTAYEFIIACVSNGNNQDVFASIQWQEVT